MKAKFTFALLALLLVTVAPSAGNAACHVAGWTSGDNSHPGLRVQLS